MKRNLFFIGFFIAAIAAILALSPYYNFTYIAAIVSFVLGGYAYQHGKKHSYPTKKVQFVFLLAILAVSIAIYRQVTLETNAEDTEILLEDTTE